MVAAHVPNSCRVTLQLMAASVCSNRGAFVRSFFAGRGPAYSGPSAETITNNSLLGGRALVESNPGH